MDEPRSYKIGDLARIAGVSVRTLHHYDRIGLLSAGTRLTSGYRVYGEAELLRLQQILLYRELEFPLEEIGHLLDRPDFDPRRALQAHRHSIEERIGRLSLLLATIDKTVARLGGEESMLSDEELYEGFDKQKVVEIRAEAARRWGAGEAYKESERRVAKMGKADWERVKQEGSEIDAACAEALRSGGLPASATVQALMARKAAWLRNFYEPSAEMFRGLGELYVSDERFKANYENLRPGLAEFMRDSMAIYAARDIKKN